MYLVAEYSSILFKAHNLKTTPLSVARSLTAELQKPISAFHQLESTDRG